jgi:hypothetical protein
VALLVISFVHSERIDATALLVAVALLRALLTMRAAAARRSWGTGVAVVHPATCEAR